MPVVRRVAIDELTRTQEIAVPPSALEDTDRLRPNRSFALVAVALAVVVAGGIWRVISHDTAVLASNPTRIYSPTGHKPNKPSNDAVVTLAWNPVDGAAGYWWALVEDPSNLPKPRVLSSADDSMVSFNFTGRRYFVLRTAVEDGNGYKWSEPMVYGPIIVDGTAKPPGTLQEGEGTLSDASGSSAGGRSYNLGNRGARGAAGYGGSSADADPGVPPGDPGSPGTGTGQPGGYGSPGEPASGPGGGQPSCSGGSCDGEAGPNGPNGRDGYP